MLSFPGFLVQVQSLFKSKPILVVALFRSSEFMFVVILRFSRAASATSWLRKMPNRKNMALCKETLNQGLNCGLQRHAFASNAEPYTNGFTAPGPSLANCHLFYTQGGETQAGLSLLAEGHC